MGLNSHCGLVWATTLDGWTNSSPALADALGNGQLQVAEGTWNGAAGSVWLLNGATGRPIWHVPALGAVIGGIVTVNLGSGYQDLIVATTGGLEILDGRTGSVLATAGHGTFGLQNSALVTDDCERLASGSPSPATTRPTRGSSTTSRWPAHMATWSMRPGPGRCSTTIPS